MNKASKKSDAEILRKKAEALLKKTGSNPKLQSAEPNSLKLIHELEVHQIELELQNEELTNANELAASTANKYADLKRDEADVDDGDQRYDNHKRGHHVRRIRHNRQDETEEAVCAKLQRDRRQNHRAAGGCFNVRVWQPSVHGPHWDLHREREEERDEDQNLWRFAERHFVEISNREATAGNVVEIQKRNQHQERSKQRVKEKLDRRIQTIRPAPDTDDEIHRDQHRLEEHVKQHRIGRSKCAVDEA